MTRQEDESKIREGANMSHSNTIQLKPKIYCKFCGTTHIDGYCRKFCH